MVVPSERRDILQRWREFIHDFSFFIHLKETRHSYLGMCSMIQTLEDHRYLDRSFLGPTTYVAVSDTQIIEMIRPMKPPEFRECFRMNRDELRRLVHYVGDHPIFHNVRGRPQRHPIVQISVFLYRLGSGNRLSDVLRTLGRLSRGTIVNYTIRSLVAINSKLAEVIVWPDTQRRREIDLFMYSEHQLPGCLGFIDGLHIILHKSPSFGIEKNATFYSRKKRYGLLILAVCDENKVFTYLQTGHYAAAHDARAQKSSTLHQTPQGLFDGDQYILGNSGFMATQHLVPMHKKPAGREMPEDQRRFNDHVAKARVKIEHASGVLKQRWLLLNDMRIVLRDNDDLILAYSLIRAAVVLHNLFINTSRTYWDQGKYEMAKRKKEEELARRRADVVRNPWRPPISKTDTRKID